MSRFWLGGELSPSGTLQWAATPKTILAAVALCVLIWAVALWTGRVRARSKKSRVVEAILLMLSLALVAIGLADPVWLEESGREEPGGLVVLVDGSRSMGVQDGERPRSEAVSSALEHLGGDVDVYTFDADVRVGAPQEWSGRDTNLGAALSAVADRYLGQPVRAVVVITDGLDRGPLRRAVNEGATVVPPLPGPVTFVQIGSQQQLHDLSVDDVVAGGFAFLRTPFVLEAKIRGVGRTAHHGDLAARGSSGGGRACLAR